MQSQLARSQDTFWCSSPTKLWKRRRHSPCGTDFRPALSDATAEWAEKVDQCASNVDKRSVDWRRCMLPNCYLSTTWQKSCTSVWWILHSHEAKIFAGMSLENPRKRLTWPLNSDQMIRLRMAPHGSAWLPRLMRLPSSVLNFIWLMTFRVPRKWIQMRLNTKDLRRH